MKRWVIMLACLLLAVGNLHAQDKAKPNTLTPKEIQDGWLLLFDGETTFGWTIDGEAKVKDGYLILGGKKETKATFTTDFQEFDLRLEAKHSDSKNDSVIQFGHGSKSLKEVLRSQRLGNWVVWDFYILTPAGKKQRVFYNEGSAAPGAKDKSAFIGVISENIPITHSSPFSITLHVPAGSTLELRDIKVLPAGLKKFFNGKDLTGWKEHPGKKSKFSVTKEGWLNVKDGPGDLQTVGKWKDFVLQLECISNGKHLNSGIFYRCLPDLYQQGYEAQIRNEFTPGKLNSYTLEKFDPKTNMSLGKYKVESTAVDFGTGAIYRRQPARKQMSKDFEWFTMTVVAHGRHMATWVNGVQVTDFDDYRPLNDNARNGCCLNAGHLSIQGHDPTTDLSFRNFRVAEMK